jgi:hypothetical protein
MKAIGFHASSGTLRYVIVEGTRNSAKVLAHERRPLTLLDDRPKFFQGAKNLFSSILKGVGPDAVSYMASMNANSQAQLAGIVMPFSILCICAGDANLPCKEFISQNFSKKFFGGLKLQSTEKYAACDEILGTHPPNWTNSERLAALAAFGAL